MGFEYVNSYYGVPACVGRRVTVNGKPGIIAEDRGSYIGINFDDDNPGGIKNAHPTWKVEYGELGFVRKPTRSQARYQKYLESEYPDSFAEFIGIKQAERKC